MTGSTAPALPSGSVTAVRTGRHGEHTETAVLERVCETCGKPLVRNRKHSNAQWAAKRFCERQCAAKRLVKVRLCKCGCSKPVKGRRFVEGHRPKRLSNGYVRITAIGHPMSHANGTALEHRVVAYDAGMLIPPGFHIHHKNGIKHDNRAENLEVLEIAEHTRLHARQKSRGLSRLGRVV